MNQVHHYSIRLENWLVCRKKAKMSLNYTILALKKKRLIVCTITLPSTWWHSRRFFLWNPAVSWNQGPHAVAVFYSLREVKTCLRYWPQISYSLVITGLMEVKFSGFLPKIHTYNKNLRVLCWYDWGGYNLHVYTGQFSSCILLGRSGCCLRYYQLRSAVIRLIQLWLR